MDRFCLRSVENILVFLVLATLAACATIKVNPIPAPPPTAMLRVYVEAFTLGPATRKWNIPHEKYVQNQIRRTGKFLEKTGIYEVVPASDVRAAIGEQVLNYDSMQNDNWSQARAIGRAVHADYVFLVARDLSNIGTGEKAIIFTTELVNVESGKTFKSQYSVNNVTSADHELQLKLIREAYRDIFNQAKHDMFSVAVGKGRAYAPTVPIRTQDASAAVKAGPPTAPSGSAVPPSPLHAPKKEESPAFAKKASEPDPVIQKPAPNLPGSGLIEAPKKDAGVKKIVVYDFDVTDQYRTVALILAEALREEVYKLKEFVLVNREDLQKVLEEMALQQTGLIDEKQAVKTGKGLAANQVVTGRLGQLGKTFVMQAKRVDVETFGTLGIASAKFTEGQEDEVLNKLPDFARSLVGLQ
jgi:hypothetical protein